MGQYQQGEDVGILDVTRTEITLIIPAKHGASKGYTVSPAPELDKELWLAYLCGGWYSLYFSSVRSAARGLLLARV
jgi:hypothetical protein